MQNYQNVSLVSYETWLAALASSACIGFTSLVPWLFNMTFFERHKQKQQGTDNEDGRMKYLLSFAVGAILGDIFFHLIPESLHSYLLELDVSQQVAHEKVGLSILAGIFMFIIVEMILEKWSHSSNELAVESKPDRLRIYREDCSMSYLEEQPPKSYNIDLKKQNITESLTGAMIENNNNSWTDFNALDKMKEFNKIIGLKTRVDDYEFAPTDQTLRLRAQIDVLKKQIPPPIRQDAKETVCRSIDAAGYLSLIANGFDNFTHGLAIGASFLVGPKVGLLTTFVIFIHEIPHEICDYAILVNSGFSRWDAVKAQSSVSLFGIIGTATALYVKSVQTLTAKTVWILPFSAGGFLYIALVNLLPEILDRKANVRDSFGQAACVIIGIIFMATVAVL